MLPVLPEVKRLLMSDGALHCVQALPGGTETDFILVGCAGVKGSVGGSHNEETAKQLDKIVAAKRRGKEHRHCLLAGVHGLM